jgi:two-component system, OmpR family, sensor histidine kinase VicK
MPWHSWLHARPWWLVSAALGGLLVAIAITGIVGLIINQRVQQVTENALRYDVRLEDLGDDLRVAVLDLRHYHRNLIFAGPSRRAIADFEQAHAVLLAAIDELDALGLHDPAMPPPEDLRTTARRYRETFFPAIELYEREQGRFIRASDTGLVLLAELEQAARVIDELGERRAAAALASIEAATASARLVLLSVLGSLVLIGLALAYGAVQVVGELRRLYQERAATAEQLAQALKAKNDFIADASHELRTPLTVLRGNAQVGLATGSTGLQAELFDEIVRESTRMTRMVEDLLFLARSDAASPPLERERVLVGPMLADLAGRAGILAREHGATFRASLHADGWLDADRARIEQAVLVLVDNAAKHSPPQGLITLTSATEGDRLTIRVSDSGTGIPAADMPLIFERFYRVDKARGRKQGGTGLGLSIAKTIVEAHGGRIEVESQLNIGTTMTIVLPLVTA